MNTTVKDHHAVPLQTKFYNPHSTYEENISDTCKPHRYEILSAAAAL